MKATSVTVRVFDHPLGDCTNGGISSREKTLTLYASRAAFEADPNADPARSLIVIRRVLFAHEPEYVHAQPVGEGGYMSGGNFAYTSDSRYTEVTGIRYPISIHDRQE